MTDRRRFLPATLATAAGGGASAVRAQDSGGPKGLRIALPVAETGFDPVQSQDQYSATINAHIFEPPLAYDYLARPARQLPNTLVALPEPDKEFRSFTFRLRPGTYTWFVWPGIGPQSQARYGALLGQRTFTIR